ncbi:MAG: response regulator [Anaerolineae bacterium]|nr:response regulator [Anaerolineae bacterium]
MAYKVFLVEDEIVAREGIRDKVNWGAAGFEFVGEAPDGEVALPLIENLQPDLLITDIKMPFMDGLQLSKIVRERMPWVKIVILSGHDEFNYAQSAVKLGISEYLLKPITAVEIHHVLQRIATQLDQEQAERAKLKQLQNQLQDNVTLQRERLLFQLVVGGVTSTEAIEQCQQLGLNIIAPYYLVALLKLKGDTAVPPLEYGDYQQVHALVASLTYTHPGTFLTQKSAEELLLILTGDNPEQLRQDGAFLAQLIAQDVAEVLPCTVVAGIGSPQQRLTEISQSFAEALAQVSQGNGGKDWGNGEPEAASGRAPIEKLKLDQTAVEHFLKCGLVSEIDTFFTTHLLPLSQTATQSDLVKHYLFVEVMVTAGQFINDLGGEAAQVIPEIQDIELLLAGLHTVAQMRAALGRIFAQAIAFRTGQAAHERTRIVHQVKAFLDAHYANPDLLLNEVAARVNLSASHFSVIFSQEMGESFKDYLTRIRMERAKELLRTTNLKCAEIAYQSGYNDPHYFSHVFHKHIGLPPQQFRQQSY